MNADNTKPTQSYRRLSAFIGGLFMIEASWMQGLGKPVPLPLSKLFLKLQVEIARRAHRSFRRTLGGLEVERLSSTRPRCTLKRFWLSKTPPTFSLRKEVIQPQVLLRLPCYDFTPIMDHTLGRCPPCGSACRLLVQFTFVM